MLLNVYLFMECLSEIFTWLAGWKHHRVSTEATNGFPGWWSLVVVVSWKCEFLQGHLQSTATGIC